MESLDKKKAMAWKLILWSKIAARDQKLEKLIMWKGRCADGHASDELNHCTLQLGVPPLPCCPFSIYNVHSSMYIGLETSNVHAPAVPPLLKVCFYMGPWTLQTQISDRINLSSEFLRSTHNLKKIFLMVLMFIK